MTVRHTSFVLAALAALASCGKNKSPESSAEAANPTNPGAGSATPAAMNGKVGEKPTAPAKAPARGPEYSVYSLVDSRLSGHLQRGGGLVVPAGSAGKRAFVQVVAYRGNKGSSSVKTNVVQRTIQAGA